jgi:hypothetical protein
MVTLSAATQSTMTLGPWPVHRMTRIADAEFAETLPDDVVLDIWLALAITGLGDRGSHASRVPAFARNRPRSGERFVAAHPELNQIMVHEGTSPSDRLTWLTETHVKPVIWPFAAQRRGSH